MKHLPLGFPGCSAGSGPDGGADGGNYHLFHVSHSQTWTRTLGPLLKDGRHLLGINRFIFLQADSFYLKGSFYLLKDLGFETKFQVEIHGFRVRSHDAPLKRESAAFRA